ncbi:hypothetical protein BJ546DRAFT_834922 [Cryomyces antarcticus]
MAEERKPGGLADLEKELTCSICTDVLFQPLTLLDCLHTFCGSCLKEWFGFQTTAARTSSTPNPYTCPQCRAAVRETRPNATVTTLLDMFLLQNPGRGKSEDEKAEMRRIYKMGESVLPKMPRRRAEEDVDEDDDRRLLDEVRELSLRDIGAGPDRRRQEGSRDRRTGPGGGTIHGHPRRDAAARTASGATYLNYRADEQGRSQEHYRREREAESRRVEHQSSLRSLLSASDLDSQEMEEEIMRQIMEEGLLDGIDLTHVDVGMEEEISERIAQAFRRRQREREGSSGRRGGSPGRRRERDGMSDSASRELQTHSRQESSPTQRAQDEEQTRRRQHGRSDSASQQSHTRPPVSRPHLFEAATVDSPWHQRRSSSQTSQHSARSGNRSDNTRVSSDMPPAARSATDLSDRPQTMQGSQERRRGMSQDHRRTTDPESQRGVEHIRRERDHSTTVDTPPRRRSNDVEADSSRAGAGAAVSAASVYPLARQAINPPSHNRQQSRPMNHSSPALVAPPSVLETPNISVRPSSSSANTAAAPSFAPVLDPRATFPEPAITCRNCNKLNIQYELHYHCSKCDSGTFDLCLGCYRAGKGCKHWFGFGYAALARYQRQMPEHGYPPGHELPHVLVGRKYLQPSAGRPVVSNGDPAGFLTAEDPATRLQEGVFCDICSSFANACYWHCDYCNDGAWGFCNTCINQGRHCTHPLLPVAHKSATPNSNTRVPYSQHTTTTADGAVIHSNPLTTPKAASVLHASPDPNANAIPGLPPTVYTPLTFSPACAICAYPIPPSHTRFHCHLCQQGDYDICTSCYTSLVAAGKISRANGPAGWRRCLRRHRMVVIGFEDAGGGQRRVVVREMVGGWALKDDGEGAERNAADQHRLPPDGGIGLRVLALWSYYPAAGVTDELMFPKGAEIREVEDINGDWAWGVYAAGKGLFPGGYGRVV